MPTRKIKHIALKSIRVKIFAGFGILAMLTVFASIVAWFYFNQVKLRYEEVADNLLPKLTLSMLLSKQASTLINTSPELLSIRDNNKLDEKFSVLDKQVQKFENFSQQLLVISAENTAVSPIIRYREQLIKTYNHLKQKVRQRNNLEDLQQQALKNVQVSNETFQTLLLAVISASKLSANLATDRSARKRSNGRLFSLLEVKSDTNIVINQLTMTVNETEPGKIKKYERITRNALNRIKYRIDNIGNHTISSHLEKYNDSVYAASLSGNGIFSRQYKYIEILHDIASDITRKNHIANELNSTLAGLVIKNNKTIETSAKATQKSFNLSIITLMGLSLTGFFGAVTLGWLFSGKMFGSRIRDLAAVIKKISGGNLDEEVSIYGDDEITELEKGVLQFRNISRKNQDIQENLIYLANFEPVTDLPNRNYLYSKLEETIKSRGPDAAKIAILFIDLDRFKIINDSEGHLIGDELLKLVGQRFKECISNDGFLARLGGDEFVIVLENVEENNYAMRVAQTLMEVLNKSFLIKNHEYHITGSIGISIYPENGLDVTTLLKSADTAMYKAKGIGGNHVQFFTEEMNEQATSRFKLENVLHEALLNNQYEIWLQPKLQLHNNRIHSFEVLLRCRQGEDKLISPVDFIPVLEDCGLIHPVSEWVINEAARTCNFLHNNGFPGTSIAVNLSHKQLYSTDRLYLSIKDALQRNQLDPKYLAFELTESSMIIDLDNTLMFLNKLRADGHYLSLDDFGTGYSSLKYLQNLPVDELKIDKEFIHEIPEDTSKTEIVGSIISIGRSLGMRVVAEGVENKQQYDCLKKLNCDLIQGYYYAKPMPMDELIYTLKEKASNLTN